LGFKNFPNYIVSQTNSFERERGREREREREIPRKREQMGELIERR
jgi:hypothetical protein